MADNTHQNHTGLIDVHAHFLTDRYVTEATAAGIAQPDGMPAWPTWSPEEHLALMDRHGIDTAVLSVSSPGVHFGDPAAAAALARHTNDFASALSERHPDRFRFFAALPLPEVDAAIEELTRASALPGWSGVALMSNARGQYLHEPRFAPLLDALDEIAATTFIHPTSPEVVPGLPLPRPTFEFLFDSARAIIGLTLTGALENRASIQLIATHTGGVLPLLADRIDLLKQATARTAEMPSMRPTMQKLWFDLAGTPEPLARPTLQQIVDIERLLYGSDYCFTPDIAVKMQQAALDASDKRTTTWRQRTTANAQRLLDSDRPGRA